MARAVNDTINMPLIVTLTGTPAFGHWFGHLVAPKQLIGRDSFDPIERVDKLNDPVISNVLAVLARTFPT